MTQGCTSVEAGVGGWDLGRGRRLWFGSQDIQLRLKSILPGDVEGNEAGQSRQFPCKMQQGNYFVIT